MSTNSDRSALAQVSDLKELILKLQSKVERLEATLPRESSPNTLVKTLRIVLMGPPGAG